MKWSHVARDSSSSGGDAFWLFVGLLTWTLQSRAQYKWLKEKECSSYLHSCNRLLPGADMLTRNQQQHGSIFFDDLRMPILHNIIFPFLQPSCRLFTCICLKPTTTQPIASPCELNSGQRRLHPNGQIHCQTKHKVMLQWKQTWVRCKRSPTTSWLNMSTLQRGTFGIPCSTNTKVHFRENVSSAWWVNDRLPSVVCPLRDRRYSSTAAVRVKETKPPVHGMLGRPQGCSCAFEQHVPHKAA